MKLNRSLRGGILLAGGLLGATIGTAEAAPLGISGAAAVAPARLVAPAPIAPEIGSASYYANSLAGRKTASGEPYRPEAMTAAHRTLPLGTRVRVTNLSNGRSVVVRVNDRGPFVSGRIIDLSRAAAEELGFIRKGHTRVRIEPA
ncbi:MAG TPA: septal ring lytic transglycosylase RlpA family protein [Longimicrobiales bacterium]|nr:septal ring lytic transglycosylase RlpA family protein [Longimicrobiales bacterium]